MTKTKLTIEYPLNKGSINVLWNLISTPSGLAKWFAEAVSVNNEEFTFQWKDSFQTAFLLERIQGRSIRFQWEEDEGSECYFELTISSPEIANEPSLIVTDFSYHDELDDMELVWNKSIQELRLVTGL